ncbi:hypothetical protein SASPL_118057 [Salvia splendens]|uniref:Uncharacterized protein n=1 Tax=Salvia splendens TaxID=180675 RepID=A0A8X8Y0X1_SALSN|nr:hypothetical protein SASPL_118057 [Salvia splendens]
MSHVRSFLCFYKEPVNLEDKYLTQFQMPSNCSEYITLHIEKFSIIPEPLSKLWNLQTLVVETKSRSIPMKANIWKMYRLRHLNINAAIVLNPKWDGEGGENLQTLGRLVPESYTTKVFEKAYNLIELGIRGKLATLFSAMSIENMALLEKLKLINDVPTDTEHLPRLPRPNSFPSESQEADILENIP